MFAYAFDNAGKLKMPTAEQLAESDKTVGIISYTTGVFEDGRPYYAFITVKPSKYAEFHRMTKERRALKLTDYGIIITGDFLPEAPADVVRHMEKEYGYDFDFEEKLKEEVVKQRAANSNKQEEKRIMDIVAMLKAQKK